MMNFDALPALLTTVLMLCLFLVLCVSIYMLLIAVRRKSPYSAGASILCALLSAGMVILYSADVRSRKYSLPASDLSRWFCEKTVVLPVILMAAMISCLIIMVMKEVQIRKTTVTRTAIKESIDYLTTGLCFYTENGRVMLSNHCMNQLCHVILGEDLQNAASMWERFSDGEVLPGITRMASGNHPVFRIPDGTIWTFSREKLQDVFQITAADTSQLYRLTDELKQKNIALGALNQRLKAYDENVEELTRAKERLEAKSRIHSELGQSLWVTRNYLQDAEGKILPPVEEWKRSIAILRQETADRYGDTSLRMLTETAGNFGVSIETEGVMPENEKIEKLFLDAAAEALTNAVRHAGADKLFMRLYETDTYYQVCFQNNGKLPDGEFTEGGGLGSLRRKVETAGGAMSICCRPVYSLTITMKKTEENI